MELIGVIHRVEFLDEVVGYISQMYPRGLESLMVELPPQWPKFRPRYEAKGWGKPFMAKLAEIYEVKGTKIIYGDREYPITPVLIAHAFMPDVIAHLVSVTAFFIAIAYTAKRERAMVKYVQEERPQVVVLGFGHTDRIRSMFPDAHYTVFDEGEEFVRKRQPELAKRWKPNPHNKPDNIIYLS